MAIFTETLSTKGAFQRKNSKRKTE
uniref:Uncharacterized protein n=1 Tax=Anguilla anguilla TaxID=7936 RepID=A0A0E9QIE2_ANGAN